VEVASVEEAVDVAAGIGAEGEASMRTILVDVEVSPF
jgi:hypothetical protein